jgi:hypothetical protein
LIVIAAALLSVVFIALTIDLSILFSRMVVRKGAMRDGNKTP